MWAGWRSVFAGFRASGAASQGVCPGTASLPLQQGDVTCDGRPHPAERCVHASKPIGARAGECPRPCRSDTDQAAPRCPWVGSTEKGPSIRTEGSGLRELRVREQARAAPASDHEAVLLPVVGHQDDVAVGRPDEPG